MGCGYVLGSDDDYLPLRRQIKIFMIAALGLIVVSGALQSYSYLVSAAVAPVLIGFYAVWMAYRLRGLQPSDERLSWQESMTFQALTYSAAVLWSMEIGSLAFVGAGAFIFVFDPANWLAGIGSMLFFGLCAAVFAFMLVVRSRQAAR